MANGTKKEAISESEEHMNDDVLKPLLDNMLECRRDFCRRVNKRYGTNWEVEFNSSWRDNETEEAVAQIEEMGEVLEVIEPKTEVSTEPAQETPEETPDDPETNTETEPEEPSAEPEDTEEKDPEKLKEEFKALVEALDEMANEQEDEDNEEKTD